MEKNRLEAFSDGVLAIIITIMVLELHAPVGAALENLRPLLPTFLAYVLSFIYLGIYWNNHHHLMRTVRSINGAVMWANMHLLFWLSLIPFATAWMGEHHDEAAPVAVYGFVLIMAAVAYSILVRFLLRHEGPGSTVARAVGRDVKGWLSLVLYAAAIAAAMVAPAVSKAIYVLVAAIWFIPDRRVERALAQGETG